MDFSLLNDVVPDAINRRQKGEGVGLQTVSIYFARHSSDYSAVHLSFLSSSNRTLAASCSSFLEHTQLDTHTRWDSQERIIVPSQKPLPTQHKQTLKTNTHALSEIRAAIPEMKPLQTCALERMATGICTIVHSNRHKTHRSDITVCVGP